MGHYKSNVRDLEFNLFESLGLEQVLADDAFGDLDGDSVRQMLSEAARLAEGPVAESFAESDRHPPTFDPDTHVVTLPEPFKKSLRAWGEGEWFRVGLDEAVGGVPAPSIVQWAVNELVLGANPAVFMYMAGPIMANILYAIGNEQQRHWATLAIDRNWGATMVLTEPDAGSDVGAGRTKAIEQGDGTWHIDGVKRFITSGDSDDVFENILHLVLARPEGAGPGTKGLSLFVVPKFLLDPKTGEPGERNGVFVTGLEHKMGLKVSATCELTFGQHGVPATGWLVGDTPPRNRTNVQGHRICPNDGGHQSHWNIVDGLPQCVGVRQVSDSGSRSDPDDRQDRAAGHHHSPSRRAPGPADAEGVCRRAARALPLHRRPPGRGGRRHGVGRRRGVGGAGQRSAVADREGRRLRAGLPMLDRIAADLGGSGFLQDYPIEQYIRDAKIDSLYEGTTAIQAQDFFFRKIVRDQGASLGHLITQIESFIDSEDARPELVDARKQLATAVDDLQAWVATMTGYLIDSQQSASELYRVGLESVRFLLAVGDLLIGWLLLRQAEIALAALDGDPSPADSAFYAGKVTTAKFFVKNVLPRLTAEREIAANVDLAVMQLREEAF